jgi:GAF domain-containing protein
MGGGSLMTETELTFFSPAARPDDEDARQALVDRYRLGEAAADPRLAALVARAAELFGAPTAAITILDRDRQNWIVRIGVDEDGGPRALAFCGHAVNASERVLVVPDATADRRFAGNPLVTGAMGIRFYAGAALVHGGAALGTLCVIGRKPVDGVSAEQLAELSRLADEAMAVLEAYR